MLNSQTCETVTVHVNSYASAFTRVSTSTTKKRPKTEEDRVRPTMPEHKEQSIPNVDNEIPTNHDCKQSTMVVPWNAGI